VGRSDRDRSLHTRLPWVQVDGTSLERFPLRWNRAHTIATCPIDLLARFHLSGNARTDDICCSRHIPSGRFRPDGICSRKAERIRDARSSRSL
jgi:hypothetical protein